MGKDKIQYVHAGFYVTFLLVLLARVVTVTHVHRLARLEREAELAVDLAGAHEVVGVRDDARLDAEEDLRDLAPADGRAR